MTQNVKRQWQCEFHICIYTKDDSVLQVQVSTVTKESEVWIGETTQHKRPHLLTSVEVQKAHLKLVIFSLFSSY